MRTDPKSAKRQQSYQCLLTLLGSAGVKAARKTLVRSQHTYGSRYLKKASVIEKFHKTLTKIIAKLKCRTTV